MHTCAINHSPVMITTEIDFKWNLDNFLADVHNDKKKEEEEEENKTRFFFNYGYNKLILFDFQIE